MKKVLLFVVLTSLASLMSGCADPQEKKNLERFEKSMNQQRQDMARPQTGPGTPGGPGGGAPGTAPATK